MAQHSRGVCVNSLVSNLARLALHATALAWLVACIDHVWAQIGSLHLDSVSINKMVENLRLP